MAAGLYDHIARRRDIIDRKALTAALEALLEDAPAGTEPPRPATLALFKDALARGRAEIQRRFNGMDGHGRPITGTGGLNDGPGVLAAIFVLSTVAGSENERLNEPYRRSMR